MPAKIHKGFWHDRLTVNAKNAIFHQWDQLEASGCIQNFRLAAGEVEGFREGWFFADSDAYKWLDAASRIWADTKDENLYRLMDDLIQLLGRAQASDGYLFTYNMLHFPYVRWQNLQIEHELYCHGHLIEAGVSHYRATGKNELLAIARKAADRIVEDFKGKGSRYTPGHEEIEIALLRLHEAVPGDTVYLEMAQQFLDKRGRNPFFSCSLLGQFVDTAQRRTKVREMKQEYINSHPDFIPYKMPRGNKAKSPPNSKLRWLGNAISGKYFQQHKPITKQAIPVGHAVRFAYLQTAAAKRALLTGDRTGVATLERSWNHMVTRRMYVTGGIGSLPGSEGFGNDYELDPEYAYAETCAALGSIFWNREMTMLTGEAKYSDLLEWQLYNAAGVGMGVDGKNYLYNNPLACAGGIERKAWYAVPCCPSNISRTFASLGEYISRVENGKLYIDQYISSKIEENTDRKSLFELTMDSGFPWTGKVEITVKQVTERSPIEFLLRFPSWAQEMKIRLNQKDIDQKKTHQKEDLEGTASGFDPRKAEYVSIMRQWVKGDTLEIEFQMPIFLRNAHPAVMGHGGKAAVTRGALVYCMESIDNPGVDIFNTRVDSSTIRAVRSSALLSDMVAIEAKSTQGQPLYLIPYFLWGNRGPSQMTVWVNMDCQHE